MTTMNTSPYIENILEQPEALRKVVASLRSERCFDAFAAHIQAGDFDRIVLSGMGSSCYAFYPAYQRLAALGIPVIWAETSELLYGLRPLITPRSLLILASQSGESAEIVALLDELGKCAKRPAVLGITNSEKGSLAKRSDAAVLIRAGSEHTVSTKTYLNTLAALGFGTRALARQATTPFLDDCEAAAAGLEGYLSTWERRVEELRNKVGMPKKLYYVGRGDSLAAVMTGALITKESTKYAPQGSSSAQFRHGPFELVDGDLTVIVFAGSGPERELNLRLAEDVVRYGGRSFLLTAEASGLIPRIEIPAAPAAAQPLYEMVAIQLLTIALARLNGFEPGAFRNSGKITVTL
jgi:glucosamine--fructose-6-phosphate aminotransferase (isomerizing)